MSLKMLTLKEELKDLEQRIDEIKNYEGYNDDPLLQEQVKAMEEYADVLAQRIDISPLTLDSFERFNGIGFDSISSTRDISVQEQVDNLIKTMKENNEKVIYSSGAHFLIVVYDVSTEEKERYEVYVGNGYLYREYFKERIEEEVITDPTEPINPTEP